MPTQYEATTGRPRRKYSYIEDINRRAQGLPARRAIEEEREFGEAGLEETKRSNIAREALNREAIADAKKAAMTANIISGAETLGMGAYLAKKAGLFSKAGEALGIGSAGAAGAGATAQVFGTTTPYGAGAAAGKAVGTGAVIAQYAPPIAAVAGLEMSRKNIGEYAEAQVGTSAKHGVNIGGRALQGAAIGAPFGMAGPGAVIGATVGVVEESWGWLEEQTVIGKATDWIEDQCIIITVCTDPHSYEVEVARIYRDNYLGADTLRGYYMLAEKIVPLIRKHPLLKRFVKKHLVDRMIEVGEHIIARDFNIDVKIKYPRLLSWAVTKLFLNLCWLLGIRQESFIRANGEVF